MRHWLLLLLFSCQVLSWLSDPWTAACQASLEFAPVHVHWIGDAIQQSHPLSPSLLLPSVFSSELALHIRWPKCWSFSISPSNEYSGLISFRIDWFDHLAVQGTLKSLLQQHSSKTWILQHSPFLMVQLSHIVHDCWKDQSFDYMELCQLQCLNSLPAALSSVPFPLNLFWKVLWMFLSAGIFIPQLLTAK